MGTPQLPPDDSCPPDPRRVEEVEKLLAQRTQMFLVPATILVAALAQADNERLKSGVAALGLTVTALWWASAWQTYRVLGQLWRCTKKEPLDRVQERATGAFGGSWLTAHALPAVFLLGWFVVFVIHVWRWTLLRHPFEIQPPP